MVWIRNGAGHGQHRAQRGAAAGAELPKVIFKSVRSTGSTGVARLSSTAQAERGAVKVTSHVRKWAYPMGALADCRRAAVKVSAKASRSSDNFKGVYTQVRTARNSKRAVEQGGSADKTVSAAAGISTTMKLGIPKVPHNPKNMGVRAGCRRAAAQASAGTPPTKKQVDFMLPGETSPTTLQGLFIGEAFSLERARHASGEAVPPRAARRGWHWSGGAVKWLSNAYEASGKCWVQCKHGAVCEQVFKARPSARETECECKQARCMQDAHLWWAVHERQCRTATLPPEEAEGLWIVLMLWAITL